MARKKGSDMIYDGIMGRCMKENAGIPPFDDMWRKGTLDCIARSIAETMDIELKKIYKKIRNLKIK